MSSRNGELQKPWNPPSPRRVLLGLAIFGVIAFLAIGAYMRIHRHDMLCKDGRPPVSQKDDGMGGISYLCHNGQVVSPPL
ncbi:MAG: hypothetical protein JO064_11865 [Actinobacteria bacterium]|nr:hypothetical protein [Actinomycetota bacterium]MBV8599727.1 hypothetical protein [Actinomycetota bacterium]